jgi:hypothetical protein
MDGPHFLAGSKGGRLVIAACECRTVEMSDPVYARGICPKCGQMFRRIPHPSQRERLK